MAIKRKRSISELSSPASSTTSSTSFQAWSPIPFNPFSSPGPMANAPHLPSRTLKRIRDSRPSEDEVHQRTLGLLYSAQRHPPPPSSDDPGSPTPTSETHTHEMRRDGTQRSLHSFWSIPSAADPSRSPAGTAVQTSCDGCAADLPGLSADAMDVDGQRRCLMCTGRRVSGGWVDDGS